MDEGEGKHDRRESYVVSTHDRLPSLSQGNLWMQRLPCICCQPRGCRCVQHYCHSIRKTKGAPRDRWHCASCTCAGATLMLQPRSQQSAASNWYRLPATRQWIAITNCPSTTNCRRLIANRRWAGCHSPLAHAGQNEIGGSIQTWTFSSRQYWLTQMNTATQQRLTRIASGRRHQHVMLLHLTSSALSRAMTQMRDRGKHDHTDDARGALEGATIVVPGFVPRRLVHHCMPWWSWWRQGLVAG